MRFSIQVLTTPICCLIITYCGAAQTGGAEIKEFLAGESLAVLVVHIQLCERVACGIADSPNSSASSGPSEIASLVFAEAGPWEWKVARPQPSSPTPAKAACGNGRQSHRRFHR